MSKLEGLVAIVTGGGSKPGEPGVFGTGKAIATLFAQEGARVVLVDRHEDRVNETRRLIEEAGGTAAVVVADIGDEVSCARVVDEAVAAFGRLDILVNNIASNSAVGLLDTSYETWQQILKINVTVPFLLSRAAVPRMIESGGGSIVNISSIAAVAGAGPTAYAATKAALGGLTTAVANEFGPQRVRMNTLLVGGIVTPRQQDHMSAYSHRSTTRTVFGTAGDAWDVARTALFFASPESRHITGVSMPLDGGATIILTPLPATVESTALELADRG